YTRSKRDWSSDVCSSDLCVHLLNTIIMLVQNTFVRRRCFLIFMSMKQFFYSNYKHTEKIQMNAQRKTICTVDFGMMRRNHYGQIKSKKPQPIYKAHFRCFT